MSLNFGLLPQVLFSPKKAFESIKDKTTLADGIIMLVILSVISSVIGLLISMAMTGGIVTSKGAVLQMGGWVLSLILGLVLGIVVILAVGWLSSKLAASIGKGTANMEKTVGFLGYAQVVGLVIGVLAAIIVASMAGSLVRSAVNEPGKMTGAAMGFIGVVLIVSILGFIWGLYVNGTAVAVANNVSLGAGIACYFIAELIIGLIVVGVIFAAVFAMVGIAGPSMFGV